MKLTDLFLLEDITDTPAFQHWFGDSKVVDAYGRPLRMYHGTKHPRIEKFEVGFNSWGNKEFAGNHKVISFTTDPAFANGYAGEKPGAIIYPVYIRSLNPGDYRNPEHVKMVLDALEARRETWLAGVMVSHAHVWTPDVVETHRIKERAYDRKMVLHGAWQVWEQPAIWQKFGWDGAWTREQPEHPNSHILNFAIADGRQVKSALGNRGSFDPDDPSIIA